MTESGAPAPLDASGFLTLGAAAVAGAPQLAVELERLALSDPGDSLQDARDLRRRIITEMEHRRRGHDPDPPTTEDRPA